MGREEWAERLGREGGGMRGEEVGKFAKPGASAGGEGQG